MTDDTRKLAAKALKPFAYFAEQYDKKPFSGMHDVIYSIHAGTEWAAEIRRSDCDRARKALAALAAAPERDVAERVREECANAIEILVLPREKGDNRDPDDKLFFEFCSAGVKAIRTLDISQFTERAGAIAAAPKEKS